MISDEDLLLYYYRDGLGPAERARVGSALAEQPELAQRLHKLVGKLDAAAAIPEVDVPDAVQQRWRTALALAATHQTTAAQTTRRRFNTTPWLAAAAAAVLSISVVYQFTRQPAVQTADVTPPPAATGGGTTPYERGLKSHLATTERQLASLESSTPEERKRLVDTIIEQNRMFALAAEKAGEPQLARVLRAFSPVLESLQSEGSDTSGSVAQLAFELRVMQGRLGAAPPASKPQTTTL